MRRFCLCLAATLSIALLGGAGQPVPQRLYQAYSDQQKADLDKVSAYLNGFQSLKASFIQVGRKAVWIKAKSVSRNRARSVLNTARPARSWSSPPAAASM
jgi:hypothetical protein